MDSNLNEFARRDRITETDIALIGALQRAPRGSWTSIAQAAGVSAQTAKRRWGNLLAQGQAWISSYRPPGSDVICGIVEISCRPGHTDATAASVCQIAHAATVKSVTGDRDLMVTVVAADMNEFRRIVTAELGSNEGVVALRSRLFTRVFFEAAAWRAQPESAAHTAPAPVVPSAGASSAQIGVLLRLLERDGRVPSSEVANALDVSETHARRLLHGVVTSGQIAQRVEVATEGGRWPHALALWLVVPPAQLEKTARHVSSLPFTRACVGVAGGPYNLYVVVWLGSLQDVPAIETQIVSGQEARVADRSVILRYHKRVGRLLDEQGRSVGQIPWA